MTDPAELARRLRKRETANIMADVGSPLHMDIAAAAILIETQAREIAELRAALTDVVANMGGHSDHWDKTGGHGAGCPACIRQYEARYRHAAAIRCAELAEALTAS